MGFRRRLFHKKTKKHGSKDDADERSDSALEQKAEYDVIRHCETFRCTCRPKEKKLKRNFYYTILKVHPLSSQADIDLAYQRELNYFQLLKGSQGGTLTDDQIERLIELNFAYKIVGDKKRRKIYQKHGLRGVLFVEKYGSSRIISYTASNSSCSNFCFLLFSCLTVCWCFYCYFGFCFGGCFCYCCCNNCCGGCATNDKKQCLTHGIIITTTEMPKGLRESTRTISKRQLHENQLIGSRFHDSSISFKDSKNSEDKESSSSRPSVRQYGSSEQSNHSDMSIKAKKNVKLTRKSSNPTSTHSESKINKIGRLHNMLTKSSSKESVNTV